MESHVNWKISSVQHCVGIRLCCDWAGVDCIIPPMTLLCTWLVTWRTFNDFGGAIIKWAIPQCCGNVGALFNSPWLELFLLANFHIAHSSSLSSNPTKNLKALGFEILLLQIQRGQLIHHFVLSNCNFGGWICVWYCLVVICQLPLCKTHTDQGLDRSIVHKYARTLWYGFFGAWEHCALLEWWELGTWSSQSWSPQT